MKKVVGAALVACPLRKGLRKRSPYIRKLGTMNAEPLTQYIYGIIPAPAGADCSAALSTATAPHNGALQIIEHDDMAAVVGQTEPVELAKMSKEALAQLLVTHQKVVETIMQSVTTIIPFRLGTCAGSKYEIIEILAKGRKLIRHVFGEIKGKLEMDVVAIWADFTSVLKEIGEENEIKKSKTALAANPRGVSVDDQMKVGLMIKQALGRRRSEVGGWIFEKLSSLSCAQRIHENMDDQMLVNGAFLIEAARRPEFERALDELDERFGKKLQFRCVGPLAPYSFYTLDLKKIQWEDVDWARRLIGLGDIATEEEIKTAFLHSVKAAHPDHCGQNASAEITFKEIDGARRVLLEYTEACRQTAVPEHIVFKEEDVRKNALLVKLRNGGSI